MSRLRDGLKELEFHLPATVLRAGIWPLRRRQPFTPEMDRLRCIFVHIPKTGGTSIAKAIFDAKARHTSANRYYAADPVRFHEYFKFCIVRNPYSRVLSAFNYLRAAAGRPLVEDGEWATLNLIEYQSFEQFVLALARRGNRLRILSYKHFRPQYLWARLGWSRQPSVDFVGRFEDLRSAYNNVADRLNVRTVLPTLRAGEAVDYRRAYNARMIEIVRTIYAVDLSLFGYDFE